MLLTFIDPLQLPRRSRLGDGVSEFRRVDQRPFDRQRKGILSNPDSFRPEGNSDTDNDSSQGGVWVGIGR